MANKILCSIEDRLIKVIVLKHLFEKGMEFIEILDERDLYLKLDIFGESIFFYIIQINHDSYKEQYKTIKNIKQKSGLANFPVMAIIPDGSVEFVRGAKQAGIEDVVLIPEKREKFKDIFLTRLNDFLKKIPSNKGIQPNLEEIRKSILAPLSDNAELINEVKRASRGKYPISLVMGRITGVHIGMIQEFYDKLKAGLRETDKVINNDYRTFVVVCPFTAKEYLIEIEKKIRKSFEEMFGGYSRLRRLDMYGAAYPDDGGSIDKLLEIMANGVNDSIIISSINEPLNALSRERLEEYKKMLRLYK
jgi:hypothetical protein